MASIDTDLLLDIVHSDAAGISARKADVYCKMVEDLKLLKQAIEAKGKPSNEARSILIKIRGHYFEKYQARLPLKALPTQVSFLNTNYNLREITKEYLEDIKSLEKELEQ